MPGSQSAPAALALEPSAASVAAASNGTPTSREAYANLSVVVTGPMASPSRGAASANANAPTTPDSADGKLKVKALNQKYNSMKPGTVTRSAR